MSTNVLMFGWEFPPHNSGGLGTACHGLTRALVDLDVHVKFVLPSQLPYSDDWMNFVFADASRVETKTVNSPLAPYMTPTMYMQWRAKAGRDMQYGAGLVDEVYRYASVAGEIAQETQHDVIHAHEWLSFLAGVESKKASGKPYIAHVHATEYDRSGGNLNPEVHAIEEEGLRKADHVIAVSQYTKDIVMNQYGIGADKIDVVHNGVHQPGDDGYVDGKNDRILGLKKMGYKIVLYVGRLTLQKGPDYFIKAAKRVLEYEPKTIFVIAGSGDMEYALIEMAANLNISENILFAGWLRGADLARMYRSADVYVLPSVSEPFGITPLESITYGTPVIVSKQSGVSEGLHHALKVDFWDIDDMASKIISVLDYGALKGELRENGLREVKKFSWGTAAEKCSKIYEKVAHAPSSSTSYKFTS